MDNFANNGSGSAKPGEEPVSAEQLENPNRRLFSRSAIAGGAVLLSLGNRSAWGQSMGCMSLATLNSFNPATGMFISAPADRPTRNENLAAEIHRIANAPTFEGTDGQYSSCKDPDSIDGVCLILGTDCP